MKGIVVQFRRGRHRIHERHYLLDVGMTTREDAKKMAGKHVSWTSPAGTVIQGTIADAHGNRGIVRAIFEKGLPGQAMTTQIDIHDAKPTEKKAKEAKK